MLISCRACAAVNVVDLDRSKGSLRCVICRKPISAQDAEEEQRQSFPVWPPDAIAREEGPTPPPLPGAIRDARLPDIEDEEDEDLVDEWLNVDHQLSAGIFELNAAQERIAKATLVDARHRRARRLHQKWAMGALLVAIGLATAGATLAGTKRSRASDARATTARTALVAARISAVPVPAERPASTPPSVAGRVLAARTGASN